MSNQPFLEVARRVYVPDEKGVLLEVIPHPENVDSVLLRTPDELSKNWFGPVYLSMSKEYAKVLGQALIDSAYDV